MKRFRCRCGQAVFFDNALCSACGATLGFDPGSMDMLALQLDGEQWLSEDGASWRLCSNGRDFAVCNWLVAAADETQRQALVEALLPAVWERNVDCGDPQAVGQELAAAGFDAEALLAATQDPQVKAKLAQNTEAAVERGAFGIPTFYVDGEMWFGKERLGQIEDYLGGGKP